ncbi:MAG: flagellar M-ring protein FliF [Betaproteobacteria bacterium]|nr:flagellar M-ring protein FliF [Betaproteobacteria bacterium]
MATSATATAPAPGMAAPLSTGGALTTTGPASLDEAPVARPGPLSRLFAIDGPFGPLRQLYEQPAVKKAMPFMLLAVVLMIFASMYMAINAPTYRSVTAGMSEADTQAAMEALKSSDFKPQIDSSTGQITVPTQRYHEARIFLASKGIPKSPPTGLESLREQSAMTTSQFMEQVRYVAAMEQELARSILAIQAIQAARVHLALPKQSAFVRDRTPPKASVVVTPHPGRIMTPQQVQAIVNLVASSVPLLTTENISVVDNQGKLITESSELRPLGLTSAQAEHKAKMEELLRQRVNDLLTPIAGESNVRSQVNLSLDFSQAETTTENFDNRDKGPKTRSENLAEERTAAREAAGVPGALSNTPPPPPTASTNTSAATTPGGTDRNVSSQRQTRNYELDRSVRHVRSATGTVERLSVAVVINERAPIVGPKNEKGEAPEPQPNPYKPEELERMQNLVRSVVGYNEQRGDVVTVVAAKFEPELTPDLSVAWYRDEGIMSNLKSGLLAVAFLAFLLLIVRPAVMHAIHGDKEAQEAAALALAKPLPDGELTPDEINAIQLGEGETLEQLKAKLKPKKSTISMEMLDTANSYDDKVALVRMIVAEDSSRVASVLKKMIGVA